MPATDWMVGVDWGGTKIEIAAVRADGHLQRRERQASDGTRHPEEAITDSARAIARFIKEGDGAPAAVGVGIAGQVETGTGLVHFAPNLQWREVPLQERLADALGLPVVVANDLRAITWGEWLHGAGQGCDDLLCAFIGTGIGGGIVSGGRMLTGCNNITGEIGHVPVHLHGPVCTCGNIGCLEAIGSGWALSRRAQNIAREQPERAAALLALANGDIAQLDARHVLQAADAGDPLALRLREEAVEALIAGFSGLVNAFDPCRLILGGGIVEGFPDLIGRLDRGIKSRSLPAAVAHLEVLPAALGGEAGVIGAAAMARQHFSGR